MFQNCFMKVSVEQENRGSTTPAKEKSQDSIAQQSL